MRSPKKDPQQYRVYKWENDLSNWGGAHAKPTAIRAMVRRCCRLYRVPMPHVAVVSKNRRAGKLLHSVSDPNNYTITIRPRHREIWTPIHEAAHTITDHLFGLHTGTQNHGREFLGIYMALLIRLKVLPRTALVAYAKSLRLKYCPLVWVQPEAVRARYRARVRNATRERRMLSLWTGA